MLVNNAIPLHDNIHMVSNVGNANAADNASVAFDESINLFLDEDENSNDIAESNSDVALERNNNERRKKLEDRQKKYS